MVDSDERSSTRGRIYAACFVLGAIPFVRPLLSDPGSATLVVVGVLAVGVFVVGVYGFIEPDRLGFGSESETLVALAVAGVSLLYLVILY